MSSNIIDKLKFKTMNSLAFMLVGMLVCLIIYQAINVNYLLSKGFINSEVYERMATSLIKETIGLSAIIITFFFGREIGKLSKNETEN